jgi:hypothetical protein
MAKPRSALGALGGWVEENADPMTHDRLEEVAGDVA